MSTSLLGRASLASRPAGCSFASTLSQRLASRQRKVGSLAARLAGLSLGRVSTHAYSTEKAASSKLASSQTTTGASGSNSSAPIASKIFKQKLIREVKTYDFDMTQFPREKIRNFCITAHIDHGKTTLSTRLLELSGTIDPSKQNELYLDKLRVEKERGITVKAQTASLFYRYLDGELYLLNLIDTPGHVDFHYEVSRSMAACEGAVLLVDAVKGVQAQTVANYFLALQHNLKIIPVVNKIDLPTAQVAETKQQLEANFDMPASSVLAVSAASRIGLEDIFLSIVEQIPPPTSDINKPLKALLFDSWYGDVFSGVICLIKLVDGQLKTGDQIVSAAFDKIYEVAELGIMHPEQAPTAALYAGQVGYVKLGMKTTQEARVGDTFYKRDAPVEPLPGFKSAKPMVWAGIYPDDVSDFNRLREAVEKLHLTDASVTLVKETNDVLGMGYKAGFLGLLHMDVFLQRLQQEYGTSVIATAPNVPIKVLDRDGEETEVTAPSSWPKEENIHRTLEPMVIATILFPKEYMGQVMGLCQERRGEQIDLKFVDDKRLTLIYKMPLSEIIFDFFDKLKSLTSGYATFDYQEAGYEESNLVKLSLLLNKEPVDPLSVICHRSKAQTVGKALVTKLKEVIPRELFEIRIQAALGSRVIASETIKAFRKDVTAKCYGGDMTRKRKLLEKQKEGKKKMRQIGNVQLSQEAFLSVTKL